MTADTHTRRPQGPTGRSGLTRLADAARAALPDEAADQPERAVVGVVRGFDAQSRLRARALGAKLESRGLRPLDVTTLPVGHTGSHPDRSPRLLVDSTSRSTATPGLAARLAVRMGVPLVALSSSAPGGTGQPQEPRGETRVALAIRGRSQDRGGQLLEMALIDLVLRPEGDAGLDVQVDNHGPVEDVRGEVRIRSNVGQPLVVERSGAERGPLGAGSTLTLTPRSGRYHLLVDGVPVADLTESVTLSVTTTGFRVVLA